MSEREAYMKEYLKEYYQKNKYTPIFMKGKCRQKTKRLE